jgi:hypothetical protein
LVKKHREFAVMSQLATEVRPYQQQLFTGSFTFVIKRKIPNHDSVRTAVMPAHRLHAAPLYLSAEWSASGLLDYAISASPTNLLSKIQFPVRNGKNSGQACAFRSAAKFGQCPTTFSNGLAIRIAFNAISRGLDVRRRVVDDYNARRPTRYL